MTPFLWGVVTTLAAVGGLWGAIGVFIDDCEPLSAMRYVVAGLVFGAVIGFAVSVVVLGVQAVWR